ncbi:MAG: sugar ABC transporter permease [Gammaproteobacteria bacterium]|jgi:trehalose/maltose transport system permease protein|uniref:carbohydrate ABC transporter permease n=1 Tax=unclassified Marinomonas TaxID=196814 RepID=UPI000C1DD618|nr:MULTISPECIES: sugar ABC transporter permease [unclassified Marinomonas]MBU1294474.1 sugar ABC transporter permease [Gammaproteobacteria bacterium]MBU1468770.1 sugar ABC transporter permease [Gammaproteobacteria bacterium]MBU2024229.1 sugar ABC transporter permease [Gammaproteobacteria bacterium]MBU2238958.1 sugar ABC transporter permease [Gammaproteobacteria bacterium]MBU2318488.1 sugar ABC transporter permease [Gammaproteobacteria bacterium]
MFKKHILTTPEVSSLQRQKLRAAFWFLAPMLLVLFCVAAWPLLRSIYFSFTNTSLTNLYGGEWVGFKNYLTWKTLSSGRTIYSGTLADPAWWNAVWNTVRFAVVSVSLETIIGLMVALVLNAEFKGRGLVRAAILIPWAIPTIVSAKMWAWMFNDQFGIINDMLLSVGLIDHKIAWTANIDTAMLSVLIVDIWKTTPFMALLCLAGLQMIPRDMYESAKIDGVHPIKVFFQVTLPLVKPALMVAVIFRTLDALRMFDLVYVLTPNSKATKTMSIISRENLIEFDKFAYGSAQSTLLFAIIALFVALYIWLGKLDLSGEKS